MSEPEKPCTERCSGHCCEVFYLPLSPDELRAAYERWLAKQNQAVPLYKNTATEGADKTIYQEIHLIYPMVRYLGYLEKNPMPAIIPSLNSRPAHFYTCKHWDRPTGNCTIYEHRPAMCRNYPYTSDCNFAECTWESRKAKPEPADLALTKAAEILDEVERSADHASGETLVRVRRPQERRPADEDRPSSDDAA